MDRRRTYIVIFTIVVLLPTIFFGCQGRAPKQDDMLVRRYTEYLKDGKIESAVHLRPLGDRVSMNREKMREIYHFLNFAEDYSLQYVTHHVIEEDTDIAVTVFRVRILYELTLENVYEDKRELLPDTTIYIFAELLHADNRALITQYNVNNERDGFSMKRNMSLFSLPPMHYIMLLFAVVVPLFIIYTLIVCLQSNVKLKPLWIVLVVIGIGRLTLNWATGLIAFGFNYISFLGVFVHYREHEAAWFLTVSLPLGAIAFLFLKNRLPKKTRSN